MNKITCKKSVVAAAAGLGLAVTAFAAKPPDCWMTGGGSIFDTELVVEYTKIDPYVYFHHDDAQFYTNYDYQLGHWIGSNSDQIHFAFTKHIIRGLKIKGWYTYIRRGSRENPEEARYQDKHTFLWGLQSNYTSWGINARYEIIHDVFASAAYRSLFKYEEQTEDLIVEENNSEFLFTLNYGF